MKRLLLGLSLSLTVLCFSTTDAYSQKNIQVSSKNKKVPDKVMACLHNYINNLPVASGFEEDVLIDAYGRDNGNWDFHIRFVVRFVDDPWGGFAFPGRADLLIHNSGKITYEHEEYPFGK